MVRLFAGDVPLKDTCYNVYAVFELFLTSAVLLSFLRDARQRWFIFAGIILFIISYSVLLIWNGIDMRFFKEIVCLNNLIFTVGIFLILYNETAKINKNNEVNKWDYLFLFGLLIYAPVTMFSFAPWEFLKKEDSIYWVVHHVCNINMYVLFGIGIARSSRSVALRGKKE